MPVFNGARYLEEAVRSLLSQTERDLILLISDNASTDETAEICARLASEDARIRYVRQEMNLGMTGNFVYVLRDAGSPFFMWAAHDDLWEPEFIAECLTLLRDDPSAIGCTVGVSVVDLEGGATRILPPAGLQDPDPVVRVRSINPGGGHAAFGLFRRDKLPLDAGSEDFPAGDQAFVFGMVLRGRILTSGRVLRTFRSIGYEEVTLPNGRSVWAKELGPEGHLYSRKYLEMCRFMLARTWSAPLSAAEKATISCHIVYSYLWRASRAEILRSSRSQVAVAAGSRRYARAGILTLRHAILSPGRSMAAVWKQLKLSLRRR
jgi:glycosyltransferase involved in cell wall biosynthesis